MVRKKRSVIEKARVESSREKVNKLSNVISRLAFQLLGFRHSADHQLTPETFNRLWFVPVQKKAFAYLGQGN